MANQHSTTKLIDQVYSAVESDSAECIPWKGYSDSGYGRVRFQGKFHRAHRLVLQLATGLSGEGLFACHDPKVCTTTLCINPLHLRWDTPEANSADKYLAGTEQTGVRNPYAKLIEDDVLVIYESNDRQIDIAARYGIAQSAVSKIKTGVRWNHLTGHGQPR